jgi:SAM-dependent methyltransferase
MTVRIDARRAGRDRERRRPGVVDLLLSATRGMAGAYLLDTPFVDVPGEIRLDAGHRLLQIGCGHGALLRALDARVGFHRPPVGIEGSPALLQAAAHDASAAPRPELAAASAIHLPFADASFDLVLAAHQLRRLEDDRLFRLLLEVRRVLKPGGVLLAWEFAPTSSRRLNRFHIRLLERVGGTVRLRGFEHVNRLQFRTPFLVPPIPRVVVAFQKAGSGED